MIPTQENILHTLWEGLAELTSRKEQPSAGDTRNLLIDPLLEHLEYPPAHQRREFTGNHCRPDIILWEEPASRCDGRFCRLIVKTERLDKDFDHVEREHPTPHEQLLRHLRDHPSSGPETLGVLTDGLRYRILRRDAGLADTHDVGEWTVLEPGGRVPEGLHIISGILRNPAR